MIHLRSITVSLIIAIASMMFVTTASSQLDIHVHSGTRTRHHIVHHRRSQVSVRVRTRERPRVVQHHMERRDQHRSRIEHHENR